jgi:hypothetical protein
MVRVRPLDRVRVRIQEVFSVAATTTALLAVMACARKPTPPPDPMQTVSCDTTPMKPLGRVVEIPDVHPRRGFAVLTGAVVQEETGDAIDGAAVTLIPLDTTNPAPLWRQTNSKGGFSFDSLSSRSYRLRVLRVGENPGGLIVHTTEARLDTVTVRMRASRCYGY